MTIYFMFTLQIYNFFLEQQQNRPEKLERLSHLERPEAKTGSRCQSR